MSSLLFSTLYLLKNGYFYRSGVQLFASTSWPVSSKDPVVSISKNWDYNHVPPQSTSHMGAGDLRLMPGACVLGLIIQTIPELDVPCVYRRLDILSLVYRALN